MYWLSRRFGRFYIQHWRESIISLRQLSYQQKAILDTTKHHLNVLIVETLIKMSESCLIIGEPTEVSFREFWIFKGVCNWYRFWELYSFIHLIFFIHDIHSVTAYKKTYFQYKFPKVTPNNYNMLPNLPWIRAELIPLAQKMRL